MRWPFPNRGSWRRRMCRPRSPPCPKCRMNPAPPRRSKRHLRKKSRFNFLYIPVCRLRRWIYTKASKTGTVCLTVPRFAAISIAFIPDRRCFFRDYGNLFPLRGRKAFCQRSATGTCRFVMKILLRGFGLGRRAARFTAFRREGNRHHAGLSWEKKDLFNGRVNRS